MDTSFKRNYEAIKAFQDRYDATENEVAKTAIREDYISFCMKEIDARGKDYQRMYQMYEDMCDRGNEYMDIDNINKNEIPAMVESFRKYGVDRFTMSSTWSSAVNAGWAFVQNGCQVQGMTEINGTTKKFMSDGYEKTPAYVFIVE